LSKPICLLLDHALGARHHSRYTCQELSEWLNKHGSGMSEPCLEHVKLLLRTAEQTTTSLMIPLTVLPTVSVPDDEESPMVVSVTSTVGYAVTIFDGVPCGLVKDDVKISLSEILRTPVVRDQATLVECVYAMRRSAVGGGEYSAALVKNAKDETVGIIRLQDILTFWFNPIVDASHATTLVLNASGSSSVLVDEDMPSLSLSSSGMSRSSTVSLVTPLGSLLLPSQDRRGPTVAATPLIANAFIPRKQDRIIHGAWAPSGGIWSAAEPVVSTETASEFTPLLTFHDRW